MQKPTRFYVVVETGCPECMTHSDVVGVFDSRDTADQVAKALSKTANRRNGGHNDFEVFELGDVGVVADEYLQYLAPQAAAPKGQA